MTRQEINYELVQIRNVKPVLTDSNRLITTTSRMHLLLKENLGEKSHSLRHYYVCYYPWSGTFHKSSGTSRLVPMPSTNPLSQCSLADTVEPGYSEVHKSDRSFHYPMAS